MVVKTDDHIVVYAPGMVPLWASGLYLLNPQTFSATFGSRWQDCEESSCVYAEVVYQTDPASLFYAVPGGILIAQDCIHGYFEDGTTNPVHPIVSGYSISNVQGGYGTIFEATSWSGGFTGSGCDIDVGGLIYPGGWILAPCNDTSYNGEGHKYTGSWSVADAIYIDSGSSYSYYSGNADPAYSYQ